MNSDEMNQDEFDQDTLNKEMLLDLFYNTKGNIDKINETIDKKLFGTRKRSISFFEKLVRARLILNSKVLNLVNLEITPFEILYLSHYPDLNNVEELDLRKNLIGDEGLEALLSSEKILNIRKLDLRNNQISRKGLEIFSRTNKLKKLETLDLRSNRLGKLWEKKLKSTGKFPNLSSVRTA